MRANVGRGGGGNLKEYLLDEKKREKGFEQQNPIFCTNMVGETTAELSAEFQLSADLRPDVRRTIAHYSISFPPGENPNLQTKQAIVRDLLQEMGHQDCQFFAVEHHDQKHKKGVHHIHIATSTINLEGNWVSDRFDRVRLKGVERTLELKHGLQYCPPRAKGERRNLTTGEARQEERTGEPCAKRKLWDVIDRAIADKPDLPTALLRVRAAGAEVRFSEHEDGGKGLSFGLDGKRFPGQRLGDRYSFYGLQQYADLSYQPDRDDPLLRQIENLSPQQCQGQLQIRESSLKLREWVRDSLQRQPQRRQIEQPSIPEIQTQPVQPESQPQSLIDSEFVRGMEELRQLFPSGEAEPHTKNEPAIDPQWLDNFAEVLQSLQNSMQTDSERQPRTQVEFAELQHLVQEVEPEPDLEPEIDPMIKERAQSIFPTALLVMRLIQHKGDRVTQQENGTLQIRGRYYWGVWDGNERTLDYFDPTDGRRMFKAQQLDKKKDTWEFLEFGNIQQKDVQTHEDIQAFIAQKQAKERDQEQEIG